MNAILVPTDFSETAGNAIEFAAQICVEANRSLLIFHLRKVKEDALQERLEATLEAVRTSFPQINCNYLIGDGDNLSAAITETASRLNIDLIVMGTNGPSNFQKVIFGSNTSSVMEKANCMVMSIPFTRTFTKIEQILFATNFNTDDINIALNIVKLAEAFRATVVIAHVLTGPEDEEVEKQKIEHFCDVLSRLTNYQKITYRLTADNTVAMGLDILIDTLKPDVLALSTHRRSLLEKIINPSITQKYAEHSGIPLLAFHAAEN